MGKAADIEESVAVGLDAGGYLFRADDRYHGGPTGKALGPEADAADIQGFAEHVLRKESRLTSRFTSFTTAVKIARKFTAASDSRYLRKVEMAKLIVLESQGIIRIWDPAQVFEAMANGPRKLIKQAADVRAAMRRNREFLIEGQIPAKVLVIVNELTEDV
jgi:hypothetical protein